MGPFPFKWVEHILLVEACRWWVANTRDKKAKRHSGASKAFHTSLPQLYLQKLIASARDPATDNCTNSEFGNHLVCRSLRGFFVKTNMEMQFLTWTKLNYQPSITSKSSHLHNSKVKCSSNALLILKWSSFFRFLFPPDNGLLHLEHGTRDSENTNSICSTRLY